MGIIISRFRKKSASEQLENIEEEIKELEACSADTKLRHQKITKQLLIYSSGMCVIFAVLLYFYIPPKLQTKIILITLLLLSPLIYYLVNKIISWYYKRKIASSHTRLKDLKKEKKRLLDEIMDKETYKVAKEILEKYAPETLPPKHYPRFGAGAPAMAATEGGIMRNRIPSGPPPGVVRSQPMPPLNQVNRPNFNQAPANQIRQGLLALPHAATGQRMVPFNTNKGYVERLFEYLIGDGPNSRYALICSNCSTHNGMALQEEFEYTAFKCYACFTLNPARKQRPVAPKLEIDPLDRDNAEPDSCSSSVSGEQGNVRIEEIEDGDKENDDLEGELCSGKFGEFSMKSDSRNAENDDPKGRASFRSVDLKESRSFGGDSEDEKDVPGETRSDEIKSRTTCDDFKDRVVKSDTAVNGAAESETEMVTNK